MALENATGGRVQIDSFHWDLMHLRAEADNITVHGLEAASEEPYAHVNRLRVQISILNLFTIGTPTHIILREAEIDQPSFHLIVYADGSTNQPHPKRPRNTNRQVLDTLFDAQIGKLAIERGSAHIANQVVPLNLAASDVTIQMNWIRNHEGLARTASRLVVPERAEEMGVYRVLIGLGSLAFAQGKFPLLDSRLDASMLLLHDGVELESSRFRALNQTLEIKGSLIRFSHPVWQMKASGQVDLRVLAPYIGFSNTRSGVVTVNASANGNGSKFVSNGAVASSAVHYQDSVVDAQTSAFSASFHADPKQLLVSAIHTRLAQGGEVEAELQYDNWLETTPKPAVLEALRREHRTFPLPAGTVRAKLSGISLDSILNMLAAPGYRHLGLDTAVSGPATAEWTGLGLNLAIGAQLALAPSSAGVLGEAPVNGSLDATYHEDLGSVSVRNVDVRTPHSSVKGTGSLGVFPISRSSEMDLDLASTDLGEFDDVLKTLHFTQGNRVGAAALPLTLKGGAKFHGQFNSSWLTPRVDGQLTASNIALQLPAPANNPNAALSYLHFDSIDADGLYSPESIVVRHARLDRGSSVLNLEGHLDSQDPNYNLGKSAVEFGPNAVVSVKANSQQLAIADLLALGGVANSGHVDGLLTAQVEVEGQLGSLNGKGIFDVRKASLYGESIEDVHAAGSVAGQQVRLTALSAHKSGGEVTGTGSYDLASHRFQVDARGTAIDLGSLQEMKHLGVAIGGKLGATVTGEGTFEDPRLQARATLSSLTVAGGSVADIQLNAHTSQQAGVAAVSYEVSSHQPAGQLDLQGSTSLHGDFSTQASLEVSKFDVGALLKLLKVNGITGQSDIEGKATISGPLTHLEKLRGEANFRQLAVAIQGVHLASKGPLHASLFGGVAHLDPLEVTGEDTDATLRGSLAISGTRQLDMVADGSVNLRLAESIDPDLIASGSTSFQMEAHGPVAAPILQGKVQFQNASLALQDFPNGLSQIKGTLEFVQNRLEVRSLTATSGGGQLSVLGYVGFQRGLYADLTANCKSIRVRYPQGISSLADAKLRLQGPQNNLLLSGTVQVTRFAINADLDMAAFASQAGSVQSLTDPNAPSNHLRLDVHLTSAAQLNFQNAYAKLAGDVDLNLRGTLASPSLLGRISLTEGSTTLAGTKYELQRGDIFFSNPVRIQPNIDLDATARVEDYDITLGLHGTPDKLNVTYRSEPPLPEADVIALLALGRTQNEQTAYTQQQQQAGDNPTTDALLGGALNATVSNRVQKLFGSGAVKIDPNFIGSLGNSTARVTVVEQIGKNLTFTYASNVNTTTQQLIQAEIAINRHVSLLLTQDESGIFSAVVKTRRRFR